MSPTGPSLCPRTVGNSVGVRSWESSWGSDLLMAVGLARVLAQCPNPRAKPWPRAPAPRFQSSAIPRSPQETRLISEGSSENTKGRVPALDLNSRSWEFGSGAGEGT